MECGFFFIFSQFLVFALFLSTFFFFCPQYHLYVVSFGCVPGIGGLGWVGLGVICALRF